MRTPAWLRACAISVSALLLCLFPSSLQVQNLAASEVEIAAIYNTRKSELKVIIDGAAPYTPDPVQFTLSDADSGMTLAEISATNKLEGTYKLLHTSTSNVPCTLQIDSSLGAWQVRVNKDPGYCANGLVATLTGTVLYGPGKVLPSALVFTEIEGFRFETAASVAGAFTLTVRGTDPTAFITLTAEGILTGSDGDVSEVVLQSLIGELGDLDAQGGIVAARQPSAGNWLQALADQVSAWLITPAQAQTDPLLQEYSISNVTTALMAILTAANNGTSPATVAEVEALVAQANPVEILQIAAVITLVADPEVELDLPAGATFADIVDSESGVLDELVATVEATPALQEQVDDTVQEIVQDPDLFPPLVLVLDDFLGEIYEARLGNIDGQDPMGIVQFNVDGTGSRIDQRGTQGFSWSLSVEGTLTVVYDVPAPSNFLLAVEPDPSGGQPLLLSSDYNLLAAVGGSQTFSVLHSWQYDNPADGSGTLGDLSNMIRRQNLLDISTVLGIDATARGYGMMVGADVLGAELLGLFPGPRLLATGFHFVPGGSGNIDAGDILPSDVSMTWGNPVDSKVLQVVPDTGDGQMLEFGLLGTFGLAYQGYARLDMGGTVKVYPVAITPLEPPVPFNVGEGVDRFRRVTGPYDNNSSEFLYQFDADGTGREEHYPFGEGPLECPRVQPVNWELTAGGELLVRYFRAMSDGTMVANCPASLEGVTCFELRRAVLSRLALDTDYDYVRLWQEFTLANGTPLAGPFAGLPIFEREASVTPIPCGISFPDAPPPRYAGTFDGEDLNLTVDAVGNLSGTVNGVAVSSQVPVDGMAQFSVGTVNYDLTFPADGADHLVIVAVDSSDGSSATYFGTRFGVPADPRAGVYNLSSDAGLETQRFVVDTGGYIQWDVTGPGFGLTSLAGQLDGDTVTLAYFAQNFDVTFTSDNTFFVEGYGFFELTLFGTRDGLLADPYAGIYNVTGQGDISTDRFIIDTAGRVLWDFTSASFGSFHLEGDLVDGTVVLDIQGQQFYNISFLREDMLVIGGSGFFPSRFVGARKGPALDGSEFNGGLFELRPGHFSDGGSTSVTTFDVSGSGSRLDRHGEHAFNWSLEPDGSLLLTYVVPAPADFLRFTQTDQQWGEQPLVNQSRYELLGGGVGRRLFRVVHDYARPSWDGYTEQLEDFAAMLAEDQLLDTAATLGLGSGSQRYALSAAGDQQWGDPAAAPPVTRTLRGLSTTGFTFDDIGGGTIDDNAVTIGRSFTWSPAGRSLVVNDGAETLTFWLVQPLGLGYQAVVRLDRADSTSIVQSMPVLELVEPFAPLAATQPGRYHFVRGPLSNNPQEVFLQLDGDASGGSGRRENYDGGGGNGACADSIQYFNWEPHPVDGSVITRTLWDEDGNSGVVDCPAGQTCTDFLVQEYTLLAADGDYQYLVNYAEIFFPGNAPFIGPFQGLSLARPVAPEGPPCVVVPPPPPFPYEGDFSADGQTFQIDTAGNFTGNINGVAVSGIIDGAGVANFSEGGFDYSVRFTSNDHFIVDVVDSVGGGKETYLGTRDDPGVTAHPDSGFYLTINDPGPFGFGTTQFVIDTGGHARWEFTAQGASYSLEATVDPGDGNYYFGDFAGFDFTMRFVEPEHFVAEITSGSGDIIYVFGYLESETVTPNPYTGDFTLTGDRDFSTEKFTVDTAGNVIWQFTSESFGSFEQGGALTGGMVSWSLGPAQLDIVFIDSNFLVADISGFITATYFGGRAGGPSMNQYTGKYNVGGGGATLISTRFIIDPLGNVDFRYEAPAGVPFTTGGAIAPGGTLLMTLPSATHDLAFTYAGRFNIDTEIIASAETFQLQGVRSDLPTPQNIVGLVGGPDCDALAFAESPVTLPAGVSLDDPGVSFYGDMAYGPDPRQVLDLFLPGVGAPTGLLVDIHGGTFTSGDKAGIYTADGGAALNDYLNDGIAYASINYPLLASGVTLTDSMESAGRAVQFLRCHASKLNLDPWRVAVRGESSGGGVSLWLATHPDLADTDSADPVEQQTTRLLLAVAIDSPATFDMLRWEQILISVLTGYVGSGQIASTNLADWGDAPLILQLYGVGSLADLELPPLPDDRANVDMLNLMDGMDAAICLRTAGPPSIDYGDFSSWDSLQGPLHAEAVRAQALAVGLGHAVNYSGHINWSDPSGQTDCRGFITSTLK